ncbi:MAG: hypothetical protein MUD01_06470 [Chloroflexaceae bacterium]|jgi:hypothetical protein|nr:hypothetical protein [Chloroflexaceae bacterium]
MMKYNLPFLRAALALLAAVLLATLAPPAIAQQQLPVTLDITAGFEGRYRLSQWFPVSIVASNTGPDVQGILEWRFPGQDSGSVFQREVDLPRGARKRIALDVFSNSFARVAEVRLLVNQAPLLEQEVRLEPVDAGQYMIGVLSSEPTLLNSLNNLNLPNVSGVSVNHLNPEAMPEQVVTLSGMDTIFVHDLDTNSLTVGQRTALSLWVQRGGQLVVGGGVNADRTVPALAELLPVQLGDLASDTSLESLAQLAATRASRGDLPSTTINQVSLKPGATALDRNNLLTAQPYGDGQVVFSAFDLATLRVWTGEPDLWAKVLRFVPRFDPAAAYRWQGESLLRTSLELPALRLPPLWLLFLLLFGYIVLVGPLNFFVLRRMGRVELAWVTVPALVVVCLAGTYGASFVLRGTRPQVTQITVVQGFEQQQQGQATAFVGLFSPRRTSYNLSFAPESLISVGRLDRGLNEENPLVWSDGGTDLRDTLVDVSALRSFIVEQTLTAVPQVGTQLQRNQRAVQGEVQNLSNEPLLDALLVTGNAVQSLGTLQPGERRGVSLQGTEANFPDSVNASSDGVFNRQTILSTLFNTNQFGFSGGGGSSFQPVEGMPNREGVYLLAWRSQPSVAVSIDGGDSAQQGVTLYVIRLNT